MNATQDKLLTPIYLKLTPDMPWPEHEKVFHLLSRDGLFICRNHPFFRSSAPTNLCPAELAAHEPSLRLSYPRVPQRLFEKILGFFARIGLRYGAEAAVLLAWNRETGAIEVLVPEQISIVSSQWTVRPYPIEVHYEIPPLPPHLMLIGDLHSHGCEDPYFSSLDKQDDQHRPGLHVVVGNVDRELPTWLLEVVVDGTRFKVNDASQVLEGFERRRLQEVPPEWENKVKVTTWSGYYRSGSGRGAFPDGHESDDRPGFKTFGGGIRRPVGPVEGGSAVNLPPVLPPGNAWQPELPENCSVKLIGLGGVGGIVGRYLAVFLASLGRNARLVFVDGDSFEPGNASRMLFGAHGNKASVTRDELLGRFAESSLSLIAIDEFVTGQNIGRLIHEGDIVILTVDNHATRKLVNDHCATLHEVCLLSGGNDGMELDGDGRRHRGTFGNVQCYLRTAGADTTPPLTHRHPEIAQPADRHPAEKNCTELVTSVPQILFTNMMVATCLLDTLWLHLCGALHYSELAFDIAEGLMRPTQPGVMVMSSSRERGRSRAQGLGH